MKTATELLNEATVRVEDLTKAARSVVQEALAKNREIWKWY